MMLVTKTSLGRQATVPYTNSQHIFTLQFHHTPFLNLFSEAEPFAAILIAYRTHVLGGTPEAWRTEIRRRRPRVGEGFFGKDSEHPPHQTEGLWKCCKLPQQGSGHSPDCKYILDVLRA